MFSKLFLSEKDLEALQAALMRNPLLASLLMMSPIDAFRYLNLMPRFFDALLPPPAEDAELVRDLVRALEEGRTALPHPQAIRQDGDQPARPSERLPDDAGRGSPDIALMVSKATLQRAVGLYAEGNFKGREFVFPVQRWLDVKATGEVIELELTEGRARVAVRLRGAFAFRLTAARLEQLPRRLAFPIAIDLLAGLAVDPENRLVLGIEKGEMSIVNPPLPERVAGELVRKISGALPGIPLVQVPTRFEIPGDPTAELVVRLSHIGIDEAGLTLEFHLDD